MKLTTKLDRVQNEALTCIKKTLKKTHSTYISMPTGTGKTHLGMKCIKEFRGKALWITQTEELINETIDRLTEEFPDRTIGLIKQKSFEKHCDIVVASVQSLAKVSRLVQLPSKLFKLIIVDEAHHSVSPTWANAILHFDSKIIGLTATDTRRDALPVSDIMGDKCYDLTYPQATEMGLIAKETARVILTNSVIKGIKTHQEEFSPYQLERLVTSVNRNKIIIESYKKYGRKEIIKKGLIPKALCFCVDIAHAKRMEKLFLENGIKAKSFFADKTNSKVALAQRQNVYDTFKNTNEIEVLCVVDIMNEGKNVPDINILIKARPTLSPLLYMQQLGRATRRIEGMKDEFIVLDFVDNTTRDFSTLNAINMRSYTFGGHGGGVDLEEVVLEYYKGKDPIVKEQLINSVRNTYQDYREFNTWTKEKASKAILKWITKNGVENFNINILKARRRLPTRRQVEKLFGGYSKMIKELNIPVSQRSLGGFNQKALSKQDVAELLVEFSNNKLREGGTMAMTDLSSKNGLPSISTIKKYWGTFSECAEAIGLTTKKNRWNTKEKIKVGVLLWERKVGRIFLYKDFQCNSELPSWATIQEIFGDSKSLDKYVHPKTYKKRMTTSKHTGVYKRKDGRGWRSYFYLTNQRSLEIGTFKTEQQAVTARELALELKSEGVITIGNYPMIKKEIQNEVRNGIH